MSGLVLLKLANRLAPLLQLVLSSFGPVSACILLAGLRRPEQQLNARIRSRRSLWVLFLKLFIASEGVFCIFAYAALLISYVRGRNFTGDVVRSRLRFPRELRRRYLREILDHESPLHDPEATSRGQRWLTGWFLNDVSFNDLHQHNLRDLVIWAFFDATNGDLLTKAEHAEVEEMVSLAQERLGALPTGRNPEVRIMRNTVANNALFARPRPLFLYALLDGIGQRLVTPLVLMGILGFRRIHAPAFSYWHHKGTCQAPPIIMLHGIGVGPLPYADLLRAFITAGREVFVPEQTHVSLTLVQYIKSIFGIKVSAAHTVESMVSMLRDHGHESADFVGHSYGTLPLSWFVKKWPHFVRRATLIDPICIFLHRSDVCRKFLFEPPSAPSIRALQSFVVNREPGLVHTLTRNFFWSENTLWLSELKQIRTVPNVVLSGRDEYVPSSDIAAKIEEVNLDSPSIRLVYHETASHGEFLVDTKFRKEILQIILSD